MILVPPAELQHAYIHPTMSNCKLRELRAQSLVRQAQRPTPLRNVAGGLNVVGERNAIFSMSSKVKTLDRMRRSAALIAGCENVQTSEPVAKTNGAKVCII